MENTTSSGSAAMNDFDPDEQERLENWRALQISLGLMPEEPPVPVSQATAPLPPAASVAAAPPADPVLSESARAEFQSEPIAEPAEAAAAEQEVELGEAPEEVPEEPGEETGVAGEKRRRRRRRRRRRGDGSEEGQPAEINGAPLSASLPVGDVPPGADLGEEDDESELGDTEDDDSDEEIEPISIPDWNVPSWQELIDSLYRPER